MLLDLDYLESKWHQLHEPELCLKRTFDILSVQFNDQTLGQHQPGIKHC